MWLGGGANGGADVERHRREYRGAEGVGVGRCPPPHWRGVCGGSVGRGLSPPQIISLIFELRGEIFPIFELKKATFGAVWD